MVIVTVSLGQVNTEVEVDDACEHNIDKVIHTKVIRGEICFEHVSTPTIVTTVHGIDVGDIYFSLYQLETDIGGDNLILIFEEETGQEVTRSEVVVTRVMT